MGESDRKPLTAIEPVDVGELLSSMTDKQREAVHATAAALDAAAFVRRLREVKGVDRPTLAKLAGIDEQQLIDIEGARNREAPSVALLAQIAGAVGEELSIGLRSDPGAFEHVYTISEVDGPPAIPGSSLKGMVSAVMTLVDKKQGYGIIKPDSGGDDVIVQARTGLKVDALHAGQRLAVAFEDDRNVRLIVEH